jgi:hypothetical protein
MSDNPIKSIGYNKPRFPGQDSHVESWFLRVNDPDSPRAIWLKATVLLQDDGSRNAEAWCSVFDADSTAAVRQTIPMAEADISATEGPLEATIGDLRLHLDENSGHVSGAMTHEGTEINWDLQMERIPGDLGEPLSLLPTEKLIDAPFPKNKLLTPFPAARFTGSVRWGSQTWDIDNWVGMQGHNWGAAHSPEYAWGQCVFSDATGEPFAMVEGASGRIELGPVNSPLLSMLTVRRGDKEYRFDKLVDLWRQKPSIDFPTWSLTMSGGSGRAQLTMTSDPAQMVCLGYDNPNDVRRFCLNSKTAMVSLRVDPVNEDGFELTSEHGGALEFLQQEEHAAVQPVV